MNNKIMFFSFFFRKNRNCHRQSCECVQWLPTDTGMFVTSGMDKFLKVWDTNAMMAVDVIKLEGRIYQHHISPMVSRRSLVAGIFFKFNLFQAGAKK